MKLTLDTPIEGFTKDVELRVPQVGEYFLLGGMALQYTDDFEAGEYVVLTPTKPLRWRANHKQIYYYLDTTNIYDIDIYSDYDTRTEDDNDRWKYGNYFKTEAVAVGVADKLDKKFNDLVKGVNK